ncbi:MAG TPA: DUF4124 domain-containing protein [Usitatibacter sp.]
MKIRASIWSVAILLAAYAGSAGAEIYRCIAGGSVSYQEFPCPAASDAATMPIGADFPAVNLMERERADAAPYYVAARPLRPGLRRAWPIAIR